MVLTVGPRPSVLIVDDDPFVLTSLRRTLRHAFEVRVASNAGSALAELSTATVDLIVTDNHMGKTSGVELLAMVRVEFPDVRRVLCSALPPASCADAHLVIGKPWPRGIARMLASLLERRESDER